jgi:hypothetical protein
LAHERERVREHGRGFGLAIAGVGRG